MPDFASRTRRAAIAVAAFVYALAYLLPFRAYGLNVEDEGTLLYQIGRVVRGELPYLDFSTGYTPGFFALNAAAWRATGDLVAFRTLLALVHAASVAGLAALLAGMARPWIALVVPALYLAFIPVYPGEFCAFNIAYPAWFATAGWLATAGAVVAFVCGGRRAWLAAAGVAAAATLAMKPNAGVFAFAAAAASVLATERTADGMGGRLVAALWALVFVAIFFGVVVVFGIVPRPLDAVIYLVPLALVMAGTATRGRVRRIGALGDLVVLGVPFLALSGPWLAYFWRRLGTAGFLREVLLIGSGAADIYYVPFPRPEPWGLLVTVLAVAYAVAALFAKRWVMPRTMFAAIVGAVAAAAAAVAHFGVMPEGLLWSMIWQLQSAAFTLTIVAHLAGVCWLWRGRRRGGRPVGDGVAVVLLVFSSFMFLQLYPRADFMHLLIAAPLSLVFAGFLLERVLRAWEHALATRHRQALRAIVVGTVALPVAAIGIGVLPGTQILSAGSRFVLPFAVAPVGVEEARAGDLRALAAASERVASTIRATDATVGFPSIGAVLFLAGGRNPTPHDYFFPGRPDHREEAEILDLLAAARPATVTALNRQFTFFDAAPAYYFLLRGFVRAHFRLAERDGRFDVLDRTAARPRAARTGEGPHPAWSVEEARARAGRGGELASRLRAISALEAYPAAATAPTLLALAGDPDAFVRRAAVTALLAAAAREPARGLEVYAAAGGLDRRARILLLRTVRDLRDPRAASYLFAEAASGDGRVVRDALGAMKVTRAQTAARVRLWAGPEMPAAWPGRAALVASARATLVDEAAPVEAAAFAAEVAGLLDDEAMVEPLRVRLRAGIPRQPGDAPLADAAVTASAATALAVLAPDALACQLTALLARREAPIAELVPSVLLDLAAAGRATRVEVVDCLRDAIASGSEPALWTAAALRDPALASVVRTALASEAADVRRAAAWTLGELPADPEAARLLAAAADGDADDIVRRLARKAHSKQTGAVPRSLENADGTAFSRSVVAGYNTLRDLPPRTRKDRYDPSGGFSHTS
ncbi:MAG: hypothetical protein IT293_18650 [Deltaproteobacteria bacterium]|nr:hypothetical protein [Deltaproteobacteria bacterium]